MTLPLALKALQLIGVTLLIGSPFFQLAIWGPSLRRLQPEAAAKLNDAALRRSIRRLAAIGALLLVAAGVADMLRIASDISGAGVAAPETLQAVATLWSTGLGRWLLLRVLLGLAIWGLLVAQRAQPRAANWLLGVLDLGLVCTFSLTGHSAAAQGASAWTVLIDGVHLAATAVWYGGLVCWLVLPWRSLRDGETAGAVRQMVNRFSNLGLLTMALLTLTGTLLAVLRLYGFRALIEHPYGETLLVKLCFLAGVLALAGLNHLLIRPRLNDPARAAAPTVGLLRWLVTGEAVLGLVVVCAAGFLSATAPPQGAPYRVTVTLTDQQVTPAVLELPRDKTIRLTVVNHGTVPYFWGAADVPHEMEGHAHGTMVGLGFYLEPGQSTTQEFTVRRAGQYRAACDGSDLATRCAVTTVVVR